MADLNIDSETGESVIQGRSPRFSLWVAFWVFSTVTLGSSVEIVSIYTARWMLIVPVHNTTIGVILCAFVHV